MKSPDIRPAAQGCPARRSAAAVAASAGRIHSIMGEVLVFAKLRLDGIVPISSAPPLQPGNIRIL
jgi:hypothetical protein